MAWYTNFQPLTGIGRFDLRKLGNKSLTIRMKLHIVSGLSAADQKTFRDAFEPLIRTHWQGKFGFKKGDVTLEPKFVIQYVDRQEDAHFVLNLLDGDGGNELVSRDVYYKVANSDGFDPTAFNPTSANLFTGSVRPTDSSALPMGGLRASFPFYADTPNAALSPGSREQVILLAQELRRADANAAVMVTAYGNNRALSQRRVIDLLRRNGLTNVQSRRSKKIFGSTNPKTNTTDYVKVNLNGGLGIIDASNLPLFSYPAASVHEFGHMLGLLDEYMCASDTCLDRMAQLNFIQNTEKAFYRDFHPDGARAPSATVGNAQAAYIQYCSDAGVAPPHFGMQTINIMSSGARFLPCHFVTIWAALETLTQADPGTWEIVETPDPAAAL